MAHSCPHCRGRGGGVAFINRGPDWRTHTQEHRDCVTCKGNGEVSDELARRIAIGKQRRDARVAKMQSLFTAASAAGVSAAELSRRERGLGPAEWYLN